MHRVRKSNDAVLWFMSELTSRIVAKTGRPEDRFHLGKIILQSFKDAPEFIAQIDGGTDEFETNHSVLERTVRCATAMTKYGLKCGDVIVIMAPNHVDLCIPFYAALYLGVAISAVDYNFTVNELFSSFNTSRPKMIFCQSSKASEVQQGLNMAEVGAEIITFDKGDYLMDFTRFLEKYATDYCVEGFEATDFDTAETIAFLIATSGTTGAPKAAAVAHKNVAISGPYVWSRFTKFPTPTEMILILSPLQWLTAIINFTITPIMRYTRLQTSSPITMDHARHLINFYKPTFTIVSPTLMTSLMQFENEEKCDLTCFDLIILGGSAVLKDLVQDIKKLSPKTEVLDGFGMTEITGIAFQSDDAPLGSCGRPMGCLQYRIVDAITNEDITEPNVRGELWVKGPGVFKRYYNNPEATKEAFAEDNWLKTGDLFYRDEHWNFYFVERLKLLLKYRSYHISPVELEGVIRSHPSVADVAVTGVPAPDGSGDFPVACVVTKPGHYVAAQDIKDLVKGSLSEAKQLRGGVIFLDQIPMTATTKVHRRKLKEIALTMERL